LPRDRQGLTLDIDVPGSPSMHETSHMTGLDGPWTQTGFLPSALCDLRYAECGAGPPVVVLPKLGGWLADWRHVAPALAATHRVIAIDPPGHGGSVMPRPPPYLVSVAESAAAIVAGLEALGVERFSLAGNSLGGCIGIAMAALWPAVVQRLALVSVSLAARMSRAALAQGDAAQPPGTYDAQGYPLPRGAADLLTFGAISDAVIAEQNASRAAAGLWLRPSERGVGRMGIAAHLHRLDLPVLIVNGSAGHYLKYEDTARRLIKDVRIEHVDFPGSFIHQERPAEVARHLAAFLNP
jgi:pimeloyl-ACP methyl ester carboxylesterase